MKIVLKVLPLLMLVYSCCNKKETDVNKHTYLPNGTFDLYGNRSGDTLRFNRYKHPKLSWNYKRWKITNDSIFQTDSRGLSYVLGEDCRKYTLKYDTLIIWTNAKNETVSTHENGAQHSKKYVVLQSSKNQLVLIELKKQTSPDTSSEIRSDIQLR